MGQVWKDLQEKIGCHETGSGCLRKWVQRKETWQEKEGLEKKTHDSSEQKWQDLTNLEELLAILKNHTL